MDCKFYQAALPQILKNTEDKFFSRCIDVLRQDADIVYEKLKEIPCITCPSKPEGSMFIMVSDDSCSCLCYEVNFE